MCYDGTFSIGFSTEIPYQPYSPFQKTNSTAEYAVARLDDVLNWGRKVTF